MPWRGFEPRPQRVLRTKTLSTKLAPGLIYILSCSFPLTNLFLYLFNICGKICRMVYSVTGRTCRKQFLCKCPKFPRLSQLFIFNKVFCAVYHPIAHVLKFAPLENHYYSATGCQTEPIKILPAARIISVSTLYMSDYYRPVALCVLDWMR